MKITITETKNSKDIVNECECALVIGLTSVSKSEKAVSAILVGEASLKELAILADACEDEVQSIIRREAFKSFLGLDEVSEDASDNSKTDSHKELVDLLEELRQLLSIKPQE